MASGTVDPSTPSGVQGSSAAAISDRQSRDEFPESEKRTVASAGRQTQRHPNPFVITERAEEKQLTIASRQLSVRDFVLLKTLGTGEFCLLITTWWVSNGGILLRRYFRPSMAGEISGWENESGEGVRAKNPEKSGWYE